MTALLWWLLLFGVWPFADPGHLDMSSPLTWIDLVLHFAAGWGLLDREIDRRAERRALTREGDPT